jgi:hypothetical protein
MHLNMHIPYFYFFLNNLLYSFVIIGETSEKIVMFVVDLIRLKAIQKNKNVSKNSFADI